MDNSILDNISIDQIDNSISVHGNDRTTMKTEKVVSHSNLNKSQTMMQKIQNVLENSFNISLLDQNENRRQTLTKKIFSNINQQKQAKVDTSTNSGSGSSKSTRNSVMSNGLSKKEKAEKMKQDAVNQAKLYAEKKISGVLKLENNNNSFDQNKSIEVKNQDVNISVQSQTLNRLSMKLPIKQIFQAQIQQKYLQNLDNIYTIEQVKCVLSIGKQARKNFKNFQNKQFYQISDEINNGKTFKNLIDKKGEKIEIQSEKTYIELFQEEERINEKIFENQQIENTVWHSCRHGQNLTIFSFEDFKSKFGLTKLLNGNIKTKADDHQINENQIIHQKDSENNPGMIRMIIESIFAFIFQSKDNEFVLKLTYLEINDENVYDLLNNGEQVYENTKIQEQTFNSIDSVIKMKNDAEKYRLSSMFDLQGDQMDSSFCDEQDQANFARSSTLVLKIQIESLSKEKYMDYEMMQMMDEFNQQFIKVQKSEIFFVDMPDYFIKHKIQNPIQKGTFTDHFDLNPNQSIQGLKDYIFDQNNNQQSNGQLLKILQNQIMGKNSRVQFFFTSLNNYQTDNQESQDNIINSFVEFAIEASRLTQYKIQKNESSNSDIIGIKKDIEIKQSEINSIEFEIKQYETLQNQQSVKSNNFKSRFSQTSEKTLKLELQNSCQKNRNSQCQKNENIAIQQKKVRKLKIKNQINDLQKQILSKESVAKIMSQFQNPKFQINFQYEKKPTQTEQKYEKKQSLKASQAFVDRMSKRLKNAQSYIEQDSINQAELLNKSNLSVRQSIANFIRQSIRESQKKTMISQLNNQLRESIVKSIRLSMRSSNAEVFQSQISNQEIKNREQKLKQLNLEFAQTKYKLSGQHSINMEMKIKSEVINENDESKFDNNQSYSFLFDHLRESNNFYQQQQEKSILMFDVSKSLIDDQKEIEKEDLMLDDIDIGLLENYQNLEIDNMYFQGDILNLDLNLNIELPDYLDNQDDESFLQNLQKQNTQIQKQSLKNQISELSNFIVIKTQEAKNKIKENEMKTQKSMKEEKKEIELSDDGLISDGDSENISSDSDDHSHGVQSNFFTNLSKWSEKEKNEEILSETESDQNTEDLNEFKKKNNQDAIKIRQYRQSTIMEKDEEHLDDSFELIKKEKKRKKLLEEYQQKMEKITEERKLSSKIQDQQIKSQIEQIQKVKQKKAQIYQRKATLQRIKDEQKMQMQRKETIKIEDKYLRNSSIKDLDDQNQTFNNFPSLFKLDDLNDEQENQYQEKFRNTEQVLNPIYFDDFSKIDDQELFLQMAQIEMEENEAFDQMQNLLFKKQEYEQSVENELKTTLIKIRKSVKSSIKDSRASIQRRKTQRNTIKELQKQIGRQSELGIVVADNDCRSCQQLLSQIEKNEKQIEMMESEILFLQNQLS